MVEMADPVCDLLWRPNEKVFERTLTDPIFVAAVALIFVLEWRFPARPRQKIFSAALAQDFVWVFFAVTTRVVFVAGYVGLLREIYRDHLSFLTIEAVRAWPMWLRVVWGLLVMDLLRWLQHVLQHKIPWLWQFHAVHHAQRDLNLFTDFRNHAFEYFTRYTVFTFPMLMLSVDRPKIAALSLLLISHACLYHANIRSNFGPLRYLFVNPQSHRVHHSIEPQHRDHNFGALLTIWDRLFGTHYRGEEEYPETGIPDTSFPREGHGAGIFWAPVRQFLYPFWVIGSDIRAKAARLRSRRSSARM